MASSQNRTDLIVVGSGVAGLTAALAAAGERANVLVVTAGDALSGSSWWAQGGIAAAVGEDDSPAFHAVDTLAVGADLNDTYAVRVLVEEGRRAAIELIGSGVPFDGGPIAPELGLEAGHSHRRILHAGGGATGAMVSEALLLRVLDHPRISLLSNTPVDGLIKHNGRVVGVTSRAMSYTGRSVLLATGGYAGLWGRSTNPTSNTGIGLYLAWQAGASLADLEFVQFHPTALNLQGAPAFLLSEAIRGEGAQLLDEMERHILDPLLPRDVLARAIARHLYSAGPVYLSLRHLNPDFVVERFPNIARQLREYGLDLACDLLPVAPAAHYCMGGVRTDTDGRTDIAGLYVAGEAACTGAQGANRLASNSLLECLVFGRRAAVASLGDDIDLHAEWATGPLPEPLDVAAPTVQQHTEHYRESNLGARLDRDLGVEREVEALASLIADLPVPALPDIKPEHLVASLASHAALLREESRGGHYRVDWPETRPEWRGRIIWRRDLPPRFEEVYSVGRNYQAGRIEHVALVAGL